MARAPASSAARVSALITEIEAEAYARGQADARKELLDLLGAGTGPPRGQKSVAGKAGEARRGTEAQGTAAERGRPRARFPASSSRPCVTIRARRRRKFSPEPRTTWNV